jgi:DNA-binding Lrp family transcriptional regulator
MGQLAKDGQQTLDDIYAIQFVKGLSPTQVNIIRFLKEGLYQAHIAKRLHLGKSHVNRTIKELERYGLITPRRFSVAWGGKTKTIATADHFHGRATTYDVSSLLDRYLQLNPFSSGKFTFCTPHNIKWKYPILDIRGTVDIGGWKHHKSQSVYIKSWKPRGGERHLWHVTTKDAVIGVEIHPKSLIASKVNRDHIMAESVEEATQVAATQIQHGVDIWVREQGWADCMVDLATPKLVSRIHFAFESVLARQAGMSGTQLTLPGMVCDNSPVQLGRNVSELETDLPEVAAAVDLGLRNAANIHEIVQSEIGRFLPQVEVSMRAVLDPLAAKVGSIEAMIQGGTTMQMQYQQMVGFMTAALKELQESRAENKALLMRLGGGV